MSDLIYLYGFIERPNGDGVNECKAKGLVILPYTDVAALVRYVPEEEFGERVLPDQIKNTQWLKDQLLLHEAILEEAMKTWTVVPLKWGTIFQTQTAVHQILMEQYEKIRDLLGKLKARQEWTVRVFVDWAKFEQWISQEDPVIQSLSRAITELPEGSAYLLNERRRLLAQELGQRKIETILQELVKALDNSADSSVRMDSVNTESLDSTKELVFQRAFLVRQERFSDFNRAVSSVAKSYRQGGVEVHLVGPFPPYYFSHLGWEGSDARD